MLHDPARHEALAARPWHAGDARAAIEHVVSDSARRFAADAYWPPHAKDLETGDPPEAPFLPLYHGAAGMIWALHYLSDAGAAALPARFGVNTIDALRDRLRAANEDDERASFLMGETPLEMMAHGLAPSAERAERLAALIEGNLDNPTRELLWGAPGTMLAALFLHRRFGASDARWAELFRRGAARVWSQLEDAPELGCRFLSQDMYGRHTTYIGAGHGFAGVAGVLLGGCDLLAPADWAAWQREIVNTAARSATREDGGANWRAWLMQETPGPPRMLMQWCHGAPGFVIALARWPKGTELDTLLLDAGEAIWRAGPLVKGAGLCHGTGGNGYALLALFERSGDERWLERARAFAMHALAQSRADERTHGRLRYSLWTGDAGLAVYLWDCLRERCAFPTLDVFYNTDNQPPST